MALIREVTSASIPCTGSSSGALVVGDGIPNVVVVSGTSGTVDVEGAVGTTGGTVVEATVVVGATVVVVDELVLVLGGT
jgi:hypothetical protein